MSIFELHTRETAPEGAREDLAAVEEKYGFVPNIYGIFAESPAVTKAYISLTDLLASTSFSPAEQQLMLLTISATNGCSYCVAAHTMVGKKAQLGDDIIEAVRNDTPIADPKMAALHAFTRSFIEKRGWVSVEEIDTFIAAGYDKQQTLEVGLATALKTMSNYINHIAETPLDEVFAPAAWNNSETHAA